EKFLTDFGMHKVAHTGSALYMRGAGGQPVLHISELQRPSFSPGIGLIAASLDDLTAVSAAGGSPVIDNTEPGGGKVVRLIDPNGYRVDVLYRQPVTPLPMRAPIASNNGSERAKFQRRNTKIRTQVGPSTVMRLGHVVVKVPDVNVASDWYCKMFGFKVSDSVHVPGNPDKLGFAFLHCGLGQRFVDHHTVAFLGVPMKGIDHSAFEVIDVDDLMLGHAYLAKGGYPHAYGVGRHVAGSQIFDYWRDTGGSKIEHWADGDHVNDDYESTHLPMGAVAMATWGPEISPEFYK
ncbi:MAG: VOC family protein, partial [Pseudomonadota bacterium]|nr:VOC family protein [Pseudomonadota bacterium]